MSASESNAQTQDGNQRSGFVWELVRTGLIVLLIVVPIRLFVAQPFIVSGASMEPTLSSGDYLIIDQISYQFHEPDRKDVAVFRFPDNPSRFYIKRIIGLPGETVKISEGTVRIYNKAHPDGFTLTEPYLNPDNRVQEKMAITLGDDEYFVLGDNRQSSSDSRTWGVLPERYLVGRAVLQLFPPNEIALTPGRTGANP